jgi:oxygen-independent coproporphyrinogen-3 oxidase
MEILSRDQLYNEYVMTSLRTIWGCSADMVLEKFGKDYHSHLLGQAGCWIDSGHMFLQENILKLTRAGQLFADRIASELFNAVE